MDKIKALWAQIQHYWLLISSLIIAILSYLLLYRIGQVKDLQRQIILDKLNGQLKDAVSKENEDQDAYNASMTKYNQMRDSYDKIYKE